VDLKKIGQMEGLQPQTGTQKVGNLGAGPSFEEILGKTELGDGVGKATLNKPLNTSALQDGVKFSNHAVERMMSRGIKFEQADLQRLNEAVNRAASKGSKDSLILMNDSALIVSVKNKTVVTVMDKNALKENVFTNIDSTIVM
jgi:flagellar operon protein